MSWHLWLDAAHRGPVNMARDEALLGLATQDGIGVLRLYRWAPFTLSFGAHEPALRRYDRERIEALGLPVVRRPTGGRAVWHAEELTYSVAAPEAFLGSLAESYHAIHTAIADALRSFGASVSLAPRPTEPAALEDGACFASPIGGEIVSQGKKVVGSAQLRRGGAFLQHGSILLSGSQGVVNDVTRGAPPGSGDITVDRILGHPVDPAALGHAISRAARDTWLGDWTDGSTVAERASTLAERHLARFSSEEWTWRR